MISILQSAPFFMTSCVRVRKWKLTALGFLSLAVCIDLVAKALAANAAHHAALRIASDFGRSADATAAVGLLVAMLGGVCGIASFVKAEQGSVSPLIICGCLYLLACLVMV
jgi:hypothetical protein